MKQLNGCMNRSFLSLWQGQLVSQIGTRLFQVIIILWLQQATGSATLVGFLMMASTIPAVLLGPIGGVVVDRYSRRTVLIVGDLMRGLALVGLGIVLMARSPSVKVVVISLFLYCILEGSVGAVWQPAGFSLVPELVPKESLSRANSFLQGSFQLGTVGAQALAGILFRVLGMPLLMLFDGFTYLYAAFSDALIRVSPSPPRPVVSAGRFAAFKAEVFEGLRHIHARPGLRTIFYTMAFFPVFMVPVFILLPFYVAESLRVGPQWFGFIVAASGVGMFLGYGLGGVATKLTPAASSRVTLLLAVLMPLCLASLVFVIGPWVVLWTLAVMGVMIGLVSLKLLTVLQLAVPGEMRGRVFGLLLTITQALTPFAMGLTGFIADFANRNLPLIFLVCGGSAAALAVNVALRRECREFLAGEDTKRQVDAEFHGGPTVCRETAD
jgi:MFS transporter, DHA3 family, macrolide efflux protein